MYQAYQIKRISSSLCIDCEDPVENYLACNNCRRKRNERQAIKRADKYIDFAFKVGHERWNASRLITANEAAQVLNCSYHYIRQLIQKKKITVQQRKFNKVWLSLEEIVTYSSQRTKPENRKCKICEDQASKYPVELTPESILWLCRLCKGRLSREKKSVKLTNLLEGKSANTKSS